MKRKQFFKGVSQIAQEGAIQIFQEFNTGMEEIIVGVVGELQFEVLTYRLENEYNVEVKLEKLPYEYIRWIENQDAIDAAKIQGTSDMKRIKDLKDNPLLLFVNSWSIGMVEERNPGLKLSGIWTQLSHAGRAAGELPESGARSRIWEFAGFWAYTAQPYGKGPSDPFPGMAVWKERHHSSKKGDHTMSKIDEVRAAMVEAMKAKDKPRKDSLSMLLSALKNAQIDKREPLTEDEEDAVVKKEIKQTQEDVRSGSGRPGRYQGRGRRQDGGVPGICSCGYERGADHPGDPGRARRAGDRDPHGCGQGPDHEASDAEGKRQGGRQAGQ